MAILEFYLGLSISERAAFMISPLFMSFREKLWWKFIPGIEIKLKWPSGYISKPQIHTASFLHKMLTNNNNEVFSVDPRDFYQPWLETNVGKQGWDWDWKSEPAWSMYEPSLPSYEQDFLIIKFRKGKEKYATEFLLRFL